METDMDRSTPVVCSPREHPDRLSVGPVKKHAAIDAGRTHAVGGSHALAPQRPGEWGLRARGRAYATKEYHPEELVSANSDPVIVDG
jgi:hypothetical protein